ncbi:MAG TPA: intradiol ring-cleavage dioxygenase [Burkholderiaceae bacterium]|jgi:protocatechuate 3,4-dioxygenase beta subunit
MHHHHEHHDGGLIEDLARIELAQRRRLLGWLAGAGGLAALGLHGCGGGTSTADTSTGSSSSTGSTTTTTTTTTGSCSVIPEETSGPYPGDGSNTANGSIANALALTGIVRSDIRSSIGSASGTATGIPLTLTIELLNTNGSCADLSGYGIYVWHCDAEGRYSMYSSGVTAENYLRGVQATGSDGKVTFTTIFPGCYSGRMPHIHFEVYASTSAATVYTKALRTSQIAFPTDVCAAAYASSSTYSASVGNLASMSFASDMVFSDGYSTQLATMTGSPSAGYAATLTVGVAA